MLREHPTDAAESRRSRLAVDAFFRRLMSAYTYLTGGSSYQEEWRAANAQGEAIALRGRANWAAHDTQEGCVTRALHHGDLPGGS